MINFIMSMLKPGTISGMVKTGLIIGVIAGVAIFVVHYVNLREKVELLNNNVSTLTELNKELTTKYNTENGKVLACQSIIGEQNTAITQIAEDNKINADRVSSAVSKFEKLNTALGTKLNELDITITIPKDCKGAVDWAKAEAIKLKSWK